MSPACDDYDYDGSTNIRRCNAEQHALSRYAAKQRHA
jgi:hypothetical protein